MKRFGLFFSMVFLLSGVLFSQSFSWEQIEVPHYDVHVSIVDIASKQISGHTQITTVSEINGLDSVYFYLQELQVDSIFINDVKVMSYVHDNDSIIKIGLPSSVNQNDTFFVKIYYQGQPILDPSGFGGFYFSSDNLYAYNLGVAFYDDPHSYGRVWFPCIDSFTHKSLYDFYITTEAPKYAVCGGTMISKTINSVDGTALTHWKINQKTPPYLVSVAVSDFVLITDTFLSVAGQIPVEIYVRQPDSVKVAGSFVNLKTIIGGFEEKFGTYGWDRVGYVGVPFNSGAMEHAMNIAYPRFAITGTLSYESLAAHELAHSWFGNLVTCASAPDMWINEGWARFAEIIYLEIVYGENTARQYFRGLHKDVLHKTHITDNGYRAVSGVPHDYTYGSTVYNKGGVIANAMRYYMGDSLFFETVRAYTEQFKYSTVTSAQMRDFFTSYSGINMNDFFDAWVFRPGFVTFVVDSFDITPANQYFDVTVWFNQKLKGTNEYAHSNKFEVLFLGENFEHHTETVYINAQSGQKEFVLSFVPVSILIDPMDKTAFATTKDDIVLKDTGTEIFSTSMSRLEISNLGADSVRLFSRHHWVAPDGGFDPQQEIYRISDYRYWEIDGNIPTSAEIELRLQYIRTTSATGNLDNTLLSTTASADSLVLLYRPNSAFNWTIIPFTRIGNSQTGFLITQAFKPGQYAFGIGNPNQSDIEKYETNNPNIMKVFPNPSNGHFTIEFETECLQPSIRIFNSMGKQIESSKPVQGKNTVSWDPTENPSGMYIIQLHDARRKVMLDSKSVIYEK